MEVTEEIQTYANVDRSKSSDSHKDGRDTPSEPDKEQPRQGKRMHKGRTKSKLRRANAREIDLDDIATKDEELRLPSAKK